jgi:hypothetical protein
MDSLLDLEKYIDSVLENHKVFKTPVELALITSTLMFEFHYTKIFDRFIDLSSTENAMIQRKNEI